VGIGDHGTVLHLPILKLKAVLCIPFFELRTKRSRQILPKSSGLKGVVFNILRVRCLRPSLAAGIIRFSNKEGMQDKIHQLYRGF
jgi:homoserine kinase